VVSVNRVDSDGAVLLLVDQERLVADSDDDAVPVVEFELEEEVV